MPIVIPVKFAYASRDLWFDPAGVPAEEGDHVICTTERGTEIGLATADPFEVPREELSAPLKPLVRIATDDDIEFAEGLAERGEASMHDFRRLVEKNHLDMKPVAVEYLFGGEKAVFYFAAEERVDFRQLVKDLSAFFHIRVDMRQIGVRDETRLVGGYAHCGQELCCARFGGQFEPVSIRMAKEQDLPLNSSKISGVCGRLMCCLRYEFEAYKDFKSRAPKKKAVIQTPLGKAKIQEYDTPREQLVLRLENGKSFRVNLGDMTCSPDACKKAEEQGCTCRPDTVPRAVLDKIESPDIALALLDLDRAEGRVAQPGMDASDRIASSGPTPRRRRQREEEAARAAGRGRGGRGQAQQARTPRRRSAEGAAAAGADARTAEAQGDKSSRRRRRHVTSEDLNRSFAEAAQKDARRERTRKAEEGTEGRERTRKGGKRGNAAAQAPEASRAAQDGAAKPSRRRRHKSARPAEGQRQAGAPAQDKRASKPQTPSVAEELASSEVRVTRRRPGDKGGEKRADRAPGDAPRADESRSERSERTGRPRRQHTRASQGQAPGREGGAAGERASRPPRQAPDASGAPEGDGSSCPRRRRRRRSGGQGGQNGQGGAPSAPASE